jgi:hypothetical protein
LLALLACAAAPPAFAANPNFDNPTGDPRLDAPDDPGFDRCESDDASGDFDNTQSVFDEQFELFGFAPRRPRARRSTSIRTTRCSASRRSPACAPTRRGS